jgi:hypothetical protein
VGSDDFYVTAKPTFVELFGELSLVESRISTLVT